MSLNNQICDKILTLSVLTFQENLTATITRSILHSNFHTRFTSMQTSDHKHSLKNIKFIKPHLIVI